MWSYRPNYEHDQEHDHDHKKVRPRDFGGWRGCPERRRRIIKPSESDEEADEEEDEQEGGAPR